MGFFLYLARCVMWSGIWLAGIAALFVAYDWASARVEHLGAYVLFFTTIVAWLCCSWVDYSRDKRTKDAEERRKGW